MTTDSVVDTGAPAAVEGQGAAPNTPPAGFDYSTVPEKHRAFKQDGTFDAEASLARVNTQRTELERRLGAVGERRPATPADYTFNLAPEIAPMFEAMGEDAITGFRQEAHEQGLTETQANWAAARHLESLASYAKTTPHVDVKQATTELRQEWKTDAEFNENVDLSRRALAEFGAAEAKAIIERHGNDPMIIKMLARVGRTMGADRAPSPAGGLASTASTARDFLTANYEAYSNAKHPEHGRVTAEFNRRNKAEAGSSGDYPAL